MKLIVAAALALLVVVQILVVRIGVFSDALGEQRCDFHYQKHVLKVNFSYFLRNQRELLIFILFVSTERQAGILLRSLNYFLQVALEQQVNSVRRVSQELEGDEIIFQLFFESVAENFIE